MTKAELMQATGITDSDFLPKDPIGDIEEGLEEVAELSATNEVSIEDLEAAVIELAALIGG